MTMEESGFSLIRIKSFEQYKNALESFSHEEKVKFDSIYDLVMMYTDFRINDLLDQFNLRWNFALAKFGNYKAFACSELFKASENLTRINYECDWGLLDFEMIKFLDEIKKTNDSWIIIPEDEMKTLFLSLIQFSHSYFEYLEIDIDFKDLRSYNYYKKTLKGFDKVIEILALFKWIIHLENMIESGEYDKKAKAEYKITFESLFKDKDHAKRVKELLELNGYTLNGKWKRQAKDIKSELLAAYYVLLPLLKPGFKNTPTASIFYDEFGFPTGYISDRMLRNQPYNKIRDDFEKIFSNLIESSKNK